jgi:hypothetical protein
VINDQQRRLTYSATGAICSWNTADKNETSLKAAEGGRKAQARLALEKQGLLAAWTDANNGGTGALNIGAVIEIRNDDVASVERSPCGKP